MFSFGFTVVLVFLLWQGMCVKYVATHTHTMYWENAPLNASNSNTCMCFCACVALRGYNHHFIVQPLTIYGPGNLYQVTLQDFSRLCSPQRFGSSLTKSPKSGADWCMLLRTAVSICDLFKKQIQKLRDSLTVCHMPGISTYGASTIINYN